MRSEQFRQLRIINVLLFPRANREDVEYFIAVFARGILFQEACWLSNFVRQFLDLFALRNIGGITGENENFEARVRREQVLKFEGSSIGGTNQDLGKHALADNEVLGTRLMFDVDNRRLRIMDSDSACESAESLKFPVMSILSIEIRTRLMIELTA